MKFENWDLLEYIDKELVIKLLNAYDENEILQLSRGIALQIFRTIFPNLNYNLYDEEHRLLIYVGTYYDISNILGKITPNPRNNYNIYVNSSTELCQTQETDNGIIVNLYELNKNKLSTIYNNVMSKCKK
jgi:hypothetical protein